MHSSSGKKNKNRHQLYNNGSLVIFSTAYDVNIFEVNVFFNKHSYAMVFQNLICSEEVVKERTSEEDTLLQVGISSISASRL